MITVRVVSAPITLMRWKTEEDFGQTAATVSFICLKLLFYIYRLSLQWILAIGCFISFLPTFWFGWHAYWLRASVQKAFMTIRLAFCGLICCLRVGAFFYFCVCSVFLFFFSHLLKRLLFWAWASVNHSFFIPWCFFSPLLSIMLLPLFLQCILGTRKWSQMPRMR